MDDSPCAGKTRHPTRAAALAAVKKTRSRGLEAYRCRSCRGWHVGHGKSLGR